MTQKGALPSFFFVDRHNTDPPMGQIDGNTATAITDNVKKIR